MFEAAGFSIGGAPSDDAVLRSAGAGVVVWSQASIRSRPFLDAAQRVINSGKAVVASLIEPPPASSIGSSPAFDLSRWDGDPNDPSLDSLFFAVDKMVNAARAGVVSAVRKPASAPSRATQAGVTPLETEAKHWRAIRDSSDPADFMDYLSRYGADGAFSEVAEIKLKRLAASTPRDLSPRRTQTLRTRVTRSSSTRSPLAVTRRANPFLVLYQQIASVGGALALLQIFRDLGSVPK